MENEILEPVWHPASEMPKLPNNYMCVVIKATSGTSGGYSCKLKSVPARYVMPYGQFDAKYREMKWQADEGDIITHWADMPKLPEILF